MPPKRNPLNLNPLQLKTLTLLQELARLAGSSAAEDEAGGLAITQLPDPHGDHFHLGEAVVALLLNRVEARTGALSLSPREMAALVLKHRHNTIRGKTVNQTAFSMRYIDQFYWQVDDDTLAWLWMS